MLSKIWKIGLMAAAMTGLMILPACDDDFETEPINTNQVDIEPVEPVDRDTDTDIDIRTTPPPTTPGPSTTPQDLPDIQIDQQQTTQPGQPTQPLEPLPQPGQEDQQKKEPNSSSQVEPLPQPQSAP